MVEYRTRVSCKSVSNGAVTPWRLGQRTPIIIIIIIINIVHEVQNKYKHKRKAKRKAKNIEKQKNMTVTTSLYAQMFYGRTNVIFTNSTVR